MFSYMNGKQLTKIGFGGYLCIRIVSFFLMFVQNIFMGGMFLIGVNKILVCGGYLFMGAAAVGYLIMWMSDRDPLDFLTSGTVGIAAVIAIAQIFGIIQSGGTVSSFIWGILGTVFYLAMAIRARKISMIFMLILLCAFLYSLIGTTLLYTLIYRMGLPYLIIWIVQQVGYLACAALCFMEAKNE